MYGLEPRARNVSCRFFTPSTLERVAIRSARPPDASSWSKCAIVVKDLCKDDAVLLFVLCCWQAFVSDKRYFCRVVPPSTRGMVSGWVTELATQLVRRLFNSRLDVANTATD